ncbi:MAG: Gfo/Idh/MocA family oxidoreductase [Candidatus Lokiarchaeota archaeon]|nr:Gfo/Idh/MocA family oxidoreductase [Candidatus Lokiarchaeota archaeon]
MQGPIKIGFIGGGPRSESLFNTLVMNKRFEDTVVPVAMMDTSETVANNWRYKVDATYTSLDDFLAHEDLEAVLIITPPSTHAGIARRCLEAGLDTWCEVPMATKLDDVYPILDAERANKGNRGKYAFGENACWYLPIQFAAKLVDDGKMGDLFYTEGEYHHSVEHYMIEENYSQRKAIDPEFANDVHPTWRATLPPVIYGHSAGMALYVINRQDPKDRPVQVCGFGNMKMLKRFNNQNFQIAMLQTRNEVVCKFGSGFVLPNEEVRHAMFWASKCYFNATISGTPEYYLHLVPEGMEKFPDRHKAGGKKITEQDMIVAGAQVAEGGHGGGDTLMMGAWLASLRGERPYDIGGVKAAEMSGAGLVAAEAIKQKKMLDVPDFSK